MVLNDTHRASDGTDHANVVLNDTHRASSGVDHANVVLNDTHRASDGTDHANVVLNDTHRGSDGKDHSDVVLNNTHRASDGKDHSDVVLNNSHRTGTGSDHSDVAANTAIRNNVDIADPGDAGAIPVVNGGNCALTSAGAAETRTLAIPTFIGQLITLYHEVDGGDIDVTVASAFNKAGNTGINFDVVDDSITLIGAEKGGALLWRVVQNDGPILS